jgi:hypothetical protein
VDLGLEGKWSARNWVIYSYWRLDNEYLFFEKGIDNQIVINN